MYKISDYLNDVWGVPVENDYELLCAETDAEITFGTNRMQDTLACYTFTIVTQGWITINYNRRLLTLHRNDLYTYTPGVAITIVSASDDYHSICLMAGESMTYETPIIRNMVRAAYFPVAELREPKLSLTEECAQQLCGQMRNIIAYQRSNHLFKADCLRMLYSVFLLDLMNILEQTGQRHSHLSERKENIFIGFIRLLPEHFAEHHDIPFYASQLHITPIYLSRIVKQMTGRTVVDYINQLLIMEASWLLQRTDNSIAQIAAKLHFSDQASFTKFFSRLKGMTPKEYRGM